MQDLLQGYSDCTYGSSMPADLQDLVMTINALLPVLSDLLFTAMRFNVKHTDLLELVRCFPSNHQACANMARRKTQVSFVYWQQWLDRECTVYNAGRIGNFGFYGSGERCRLK